MVEGPVYSPPQKFENTALLQRLSPPSIVWTYPNTNTNTKILEHEAFGKRHGKRSSNWRNLKTPVLRFCVDWTFWAFWNRWRRDNHVNSLTEPSSNTNSKWPVIGCDRRSVDGALFIHDWLCPPWKIWQASRFDLLRENVFIGIMDGSFMHGARETHEGVKILHFSVS